MNFDAKKFIETLGCRFNQITEEFENEVFIELAGIVDCMPNASLVLNNIAQLGFTVIDQDQETIRSKKGFEELVVSICRQPNKMKGTVEIKLNLSWRSKERPPILSPIFTWGGREWPVVLEASCLHGMHQRGFIIEGHFRGNQFEESANEFKSWARDAGFRNYSSYEPDLDGDVTLADEAYVCSLKKRGGKWATFSVMLRD